MSGCAALRGDKATEKAFCVGQERRGHVHEQAGMLASEATGRNFDRLVIFKCFPFSNGSQDDML